MSELSVRVRRIDDLVPLEVEGENAQLTINDDDKFVVSHPTNDYHGERYAAFARSINLDQLKQYINAYVVQELSNVEISQLKNGGDFMASITDEIENMRNQQKDTFSGNSYTKTTDYAIGLMENVEGAPNTKWTASDEHVFMQDGNAYVHATIKTAGTTNNTWSDVACLQVHTNDGWETICSEPIPTTNNTIFDLEVHGYFYAGTRLRTFSRALSKTGVTRLSGIGSGGNTPPFADSIMSVTEVSNEKPFLKGSRSWRAVIPGSGKASPVNSSTLSADGFITATGMFANSLAIAKSYDNIHQPWVDPMVYLVRNDTGEQLANTYNVVPFGAADVITNDSFHGRYSYTNAENGNIQVSISSDMKMLDGKGITNVGGYKNAALVNYIPANEISGIIDAFKADSPLSGLTILSNLEKEFTHESAYHEFEYGKYLGRPQGGLTSTYESKITSEYGTQRKNMAVIGVGSDGPNFVRQGSGDRLSSYSMANPDGTDAQPFATMVKNPDPISVYISEQQIHEDVNDPNTTSLKGSMKFRYQILSKNLTRIRCFPKNVNTGKTKDTGATDMYSDKHKGYLNYHDIAAPLTKATFATNDTLSDLTLDDSAFAFCTSLKEVSIPKGMSVNGHATFFMGDNSKLVAQAIDTTSNAATKIKAAAQKVVPQLTSVVFGNEANYVPNGAYPSALTHIENGVLDNTFNGCASLRSVNLEATDATEMSETFVNCRRLSAITFPSTLQTITTAPFTGCNSLSSIVVDSQLTSVNQKAFDGLSICLTAQNTPTNGVYKYQLGRDYEFGIMLSGEASDYGSNDKIGQEISATVEQLMLTKPFMFNSTSKTSRRMYIYDCGRKHIQREGKNLVYNPLKNIGTSTVAKNYKFDIQNIIAADQAPLC